jgi:hypothetical protein
LLGNLLDLMETLRVVAKQLYYVFTVTAVVENYMTYFMEMRLPLSK